MSKDDHENGKPKLRKGELMQSGELAFMARLISIASFMAAEIPRDQYGFVPEVMGVIVFVTANFEFLLKSLKRPGK